MPIAKLVQDENLCLKSIYIFIFLRKWLIVMLDKTLIPRLGLCRALWSCTETVICTFNPLATIEEYNMEKIHGIFSSKNIISLWLKKERYEHLGWGWVNDQEIFIREVLELLLWGRAEFSAKNFPSLVSHDPSEIILIKCGTQEKCLNIINVEKSFIYIKYLTDHKLLISSVYIYKYIYLIIVDILPVLNYF